MAECGVIQVLWVREPENVTTAFISAFHKSCTHGLQIVEVFLPANPIPCCCNISHENRFRMHSGGTDSININQFASGRKRRACARVEKERKKGARRMKSTRNKITLEPFLGVESLFYPRSLSFFFLSSPEFSGSGHSEYRTSSFRQLEK
ncbi:hypothetical protein CEXT_42621 [Caerostris extrusa]|uniref:Uncharacterized protein n=1 Tax=Caerostris extrusa TaxID=172846 RepID=A0AAV4MVF7_CAEEX|nr:hypothetical protein CEXT_42621 [Caerostris extrusa]